MGIISSLKHKGISMKIDNTFEVYVPKEWTFDVPQGTYSGKLNSFKLYEKEANGNKELMIRFLFELDIPSITAKTAMAGQNFVFDLTPGTPLRQFLIDWLGMEYLEKIAGTNWSLKSLEEHPGEFAIAHIHNSKYPRPLVVISKALPKAPPQIKDESIKEVAEHI